LTREPIDHSRSPHGRRTVQELEFYSLWDATLRLGSSVRSLEAPFAHPELGIRARAGAGSDLAGELAETTPAALLGVELGKTAAQKKSPARV